MALWERAGPAVILSFLIAGAVCACAALAYAELATLINLPAVLVSLTIAGMLIAGTRESAILNIVRHVVHAVG